MVSPLRRPQLERKSHGLKPKEALKKRVRDARFPLRKPMSFCQVLARIGITGEVFWRIYDQRIHSHDYNLNVLGLQLPDALQAALPGAAGGEDPMEYDEAYS
ncbi:hypothetical protein JRQ81_003771 [Phrynocephalus forsythii]|uniref:Uncharacterized protein n=1 Tax=Phrynocephalus forsythii TaxID=171643 RepID=A0A9Q1AXR7_9SAUR|nr:hypothetical protein JRQ81_003771 [Phrynocephalus forsythii]